MLCPIQSGRSMIDEMKALERKQIMDTNKSPGWEA